MNMFFAGTFVCGLICFTATIVGVVLWHDYKDMKGWG